MLTDNLEPMPPLNKPGSLARIALRGNPPQEIAGLLSRLHIDPSGGGGLDADLVAFFTRRTQGGWSLSLRTGINPRMIDQALAADNPYVAASLLMSQVLGLEEPFLAATARTFALLLDAAALTATPDNILIEGPIGSGKRSLARLVHRLGGGSDDHLTCVDCAVPGEFACAIARSPANQVACSSRRMVLLERIGELSPSEQHALSALMERDRSARYVATAKLAIDGMIGRGVIIPALRRRFAATLTLLPLAQRRDDLIMLARYFLHRLDRSLRLAPDALMLLRRVRLPGNIRELRNLITRLAMMADNAAIITAPDVRRAQAIDPPYRGQPAKAPVRVPMAPHARSRARLHLVARRAQAR